MSRSLVPIVRWVVSSFLLVRVLVQRQQVVWVKFPEGDCIFWFAERVSCREFYVLVAFLLRVSHPLSGKIITVEKLRSLWPFKL